MESFQDDIVRALASIKSAPFVAELKKKIDFWVPRRKETVKALKELATECDETYTRNNSVKLAGAGTGLLVTLGGLAAIAVTGGLATPFVVGGTVLTIAGGAAVGVADYLNSSCSEEARERTQKTLDKEKSAYEDVRLVILELQHTLESTCVDSGWSREKGLAELLSADLKVEVGGIIIESGKEGARALQIGLTGKHLISDYKEVCEAAKTAAEGAKATAAGARKVAEAAKEAGDLKVAESATAAAQTAEDAAAAADKSFKTCKGAAEATMNAVEASEAAAKAAAEGSEATVKAAEKTTGNSASRFVLAAVEGARIAVAGAEVASKAAKVVTSGANIVSKVGKALGRVVPVLNVVYFILDTKDATEAGMQLAEGESKVGHHLRVKAMDLDDEVHYVEALYLRLSATV